MSISSGVEQQWIEKGYKHFALYGPKNLSIKKLSKELGSSRGSFYHHFGDLEIFVQRLLDMHWQIILEYCSVGSKECKNYYPDLFLLLEKLSTPVKFHKQLFIHRNNPAYNYIFIKASNLSAKSFVLNLFSKQFGLRFNYNDTFDLYLTIEESWFSRLSQDDLSSAIKMQEIAKEIIDSVLKFVSTDLYSKIKRTTKST